MNANAPANAPANVMESFEVNNPNATTFLNNNAPTVEGFTGGSFAAF